MIRPIRKIRSLRDGVTSVEMALVLPGFLAIILGCLEFSRLSLVRNQTDNAVYQAARYAMAAGTTGEQVNDRAESVLQVYGISDVSTTVRYEDEDGSVVTPQQALRVSVEMEVPYTLAFFPQGTFPVNLQSRVTLRTNRHNEDDL